MPCNQPPWGEMVAVNVNSGDIAWKVPLGVTDSLPADKQNTGRPGIGGSIATAGGLVFVGTTDDKRFRALDGRTLDAALAHLPVDQRAALVLRELCALDYAEIGEVLAIPPGTVRSRIARARAALAQALGNPPALDDRPTSTP